MREENSVPASYQTHPYFRRRFAAVGRKLAFTAQSEAEWKAWRRKTLRKLRSLTGYDTMLKAPLNPRITEELVQHDVFEGEHRWNGVQAIPWMKRFLAG